MTKRKVHTYRGIPFTVPKDSGEYRYSYEPTLKQIRNLIDMAAVLRGSPPPKFDMGNFAFLDYEYGDSRYEALPKSIKDALSFAGNISSPVVVKRIKEKNICGTSCCALGTAAYHGVGKITKDMNWNDYARAVFGLHNLHDLWHYLFSGGWNLIDNTPEGAAARILKLVTEGPEKIMEISIQVNGRILHSWENALETIYLDADRASVPNFYKDYLTVGIEA